MQKDTWISTVNFYFVQLFISFSFFFPSDLFHIKKIMFIGIVLLNVPILMKEKFSREDIWILIIGTGFPIITILYSIFLTNEISSSITQGIAPFFFILLIIIQKNKIDFEKIILFSTLLLILFYLGVIVFDLANIVDIGSAGSIWAQKVGIGYFGEDPSNPFYYKVFVKTSPLLVIPFFYGLEKNKYVLSILSYLCMILSGTKANVFFPLIGVAFFLYANFKLQSRKKRIFMLCILAFVCLLAIINYQFFIDVFIRKSQESNSVRIGHLKSFINLYLDNPKLFWTGMGIGSEFFSTGVSAWISSFEFSFLDLFRQLGFIFFAIFMVFLIYPFLKMKSLTRYYLCAFITYLIIAFTNPLLYSSTGFIMYVYVYFCLIREMKGYER